MNELLLVLKATLILVVALGAAWYGRRAPAALRALILACGFGVLLTLPLVSFTFNGGTVTVAIPAAAASSFARVALADHAGAAAGEPQSIRYGGATRATSFPIPSAFDVLRALWALGALVVAGRIGAALVRVSRIRRTGAPWQAGDAQLEATLGDTSSSRRVRVFLHHDLAAPMTCGLMRPVIGLPADAPAWRESDLQRALIHEMEHVRRFDWPVQLLAEVVCAIYWFHPLAWMASRQLRLECEHACDDAVVRRTESAEYAQQLLGFARRLASRRSPYPLLSMADGGSLSERVRAVLDPAHPRQKIHVAAVAVTVCAAVALALTVGPVQVVARQGTDSLSIPTSISSNSFDNVSVRPSIEGEGSAGPSFDRATGRLVFRRQTLLSLIATAYAPIPSFATGPEVWLLELPEQRLTGGPSWARVDEFTVEATISRPGTLPEFTLPEYQAMLRRLLQEQFGLAVHVDVNYTPGYRLVRARNSKGLGPRLRPVQSCIGPLPSEAGPGQFRLRCATMPMMAASITLTEVLGRPIVDRTGLTGTFDVSVDYAPTREELSTIYELEPEDLPAEFFSRPTITTAFREQLGLEIEPTQAAVDMLVVDSAERPAEQR